MNDLKSIGSNIAAIRKGKNLTQEDLSGIIDIDRSYLSEIENGHKNFSITVLLKIANALDVQPEAILKF
ncbi:MAG: DNA-binding protein [Zetaproteobacteria bacterium]|nr:MAG: DNA-binding protein [Zetaproteobacteria bacterium]